MYIHYVETNETIVLRVLDFWLLLQSLHNVAKEYESD